MLRNLSAFCYHNMQWSAMHLLFFRVEVKFIIVTLFLL